ncbi:hypothetical protein SRB5_56440 [Streptomyces sp. RB5]|uniref:DUF397 domain-containing protein n=1 Tax=Streptomyces smaragdinus TaxID=2585196 RepID=A0A7K0CR36_9ACTN|nr:DUF397 domain-containing protein [Streptomyces smaragdinus]MQY15462.1 hypothetical protein [Streptomyces smaragdinus]
MRKNREVVTPFIKSSASGGPNTDCVEVAHTADGGRAVRDSKNPEAVQYYTPTEWAAFLTGVRAGEFD